VEIYSLLTSAVTAGAALGGVYLTNILRRKHDSDVRAEARRDAREQIILERAEQLYLNFDILRAILQGVFDRDFNYLEGRTSDKEYRASDEGLPENYVSEANKAKFNIEAYFPDVFRSYQEWKQVLADTFRMHDKLVKKKLEGAPVSEEEVNEYKGLASLTLTDLERICSSVAATCMAKY
jgi:hypothetical protein